MQEKRKRDYAALTGCGKYRVFADFSSAERWARGLVASSRNDQFAKRVSLYLGNTPVAEVMLDGAGRVWTDIKESSEI